MSLTSVLDTHRDDNYGRGTILQKYVSLSNGANEIVAAQAGKQIQILTMSISTNVAGVFTLKTGTDTIFPFSFPLEVRMSPLVQSSQEDRCLFAGNVGEDLNINVTPNPSTAGVYIQYRYR